MATTLASRLVSREVSVPSLFQGRTPRQRPKWADPEQSIGRYIGKVGNDSCWEAKGPARDAFKMIAPEIKSYLERSVEPISGWITWSIYMIGRAANSSAPTIMFCGEVTSHRKEVRALIRSSGILDAYPGIKTGHMARAPDFDQLVTLALPHVSDEAGNGTNIEIYADRTANPCGMRLFLRTPTGPGSRATIGGVINLRDKFYYTTAAHIFLQKSPAGEVPIHHEDHEVEIDDSETEYSSDDQEYQDNDPKTIGHGGTAPPVRRLISTSRCASEESFREDLSPSSVAPVVPGYANHDPREARTLDGDEQGQRNHVDYSNHQALRNLGNPFLTSLKEGNPGLDYALIEVVDPLHQTVNKIAQVDSAESSEVHSLATAGYQDAPVACMTSRGSLAGTISGTPIYVRAPAENVFVEALIVRTNVEFEIGDCGAWVADAATGNLYGHIVAGSPSSSAAVVMPFPRVFEDIVARTGEEPSFPVATDLSSPDANTEQPQSSYLPDNRTNQHAEMVAWSRALTKKHRMLLRANHKIATRSQTAIRSEDEDGFAKNGLSAGHLLLSKGKGRATTDQEPPAYSSINLNMNFLLIPTPPRLEDKSAVNFYHLLSKLSDVPIKWENPGLLDEALQLVPLDRIYHAAAEEAELYKALAFSMNDGRSPQWGYQDCVLRALSQWFRNEFFTWVNNPRCPVCYSDTRSMGMTRPTPEEVACGASRTELYRCSVATCCAFERFPRYSDVWTLLQSRRGRVGEWTNCFGMLCRAMGSRVRCVWTEEDHSFIEVYSEHCRRWVTADPCQGNWDSPRFYTEELGMKFSYCIAFSTDGAADVSRRYARKTDDCKPRRRCSEPVLLYVIDKINEARRENRSEEERLALEAEDKREFQELQQYILESAVESLLGDIDGDLPATPISGLLSPRKMTSEKVSSTAMSNRDRSRAAIGRLESSGGSGPGI